MVDIPNVFIQMPIPYKDADERIIMKVRGALVDILVEMDPNPYGPNVVYENSKKVLYLVALRAFYGLL